MSLNHVFEKSKQEVFKESNNKHLKKSDINSIELSKNTIKARKVEKINELMIVPEDYEEIAEQKLMSYDLFIQIASQRFSIQYP